MADLEGFLWFLQKPLLKPEETLQDKFALKLYKPTNLYTAIEVNSYLETLEIFSTYVRQHRCTFLMGLVTFTSFDAPDITDLVMSLLISGW